MSIKEVDVMLLSLPERRRAYKQQIRMDITEAIGKRINQFEFEGDYNWKYLAQYAREEADYIFRTTVYTPASQKVKKVLAELYHKEYIFPVSAFEYRGQYIRIINQNRKDRNHVFGRINYDIEDTFYETLLHDTKEKYERVNQRERK